MIDPTGRAALLGRLQAFGTDLDRWPRGMSAGVREAVLADPELRAAFERERALDRALAAHNADLSDPDIAAAAGRVRSAVLRRVAAGPLGAIAWQRVAAAMLVAGTLGGAVNLVRTEAAPETSEAVWIDPLYSLDEPLVR